MNSTRKTHLLDTDAFNAAPRKTLPLSRTLACRWDLLAIISLLIASGAYSICAVTQMTGF